MTMPERPDDELLSAILDGEADVAAIRAVEADPRARARLEELRAVRIILRSSPEPTGAPPARIAVEAALAEFDRREGVRDPGPRDEAVIPLDAARTRNRRRPARRSGSNRAPFAVAAAAVLLVVVGLGVMSRNGSGGDTNAAEVATVATTTAARGDSNAAAGTVEIAPQALEDGAVQDEAASSPAAAEAGAAEAPVGGKEGEAAATTAAASDAIPPVDPDLQRCATDLGLVAENLDSTEVVDSAQPGLTLDVTTTTGEAFRIRFDPTACPLLDGPTPRP